MRRPSRLAVVVAVVVVAAVGVWASPAGAILTGSCQVIVNGVDVAPLPVDDPAAAIKVPEGGSVAWSVSAPTAVQSRRLVMSFAGVDVTVDRGTSTGTQGGSRSDVVNIDDYAWMGAGLYQVSGVGRMADGSTCSGAVLIEVGGSPLGTAAGVVGLILTVLGGAGIIAGAVRQGGGRLVKDLIDLIQLGGFAEPAAEPVTDVNVEGTGGTSPAAETVPGTESGPEAGGAGDGPPAAEAPPADAPGAEEPKPPPLPGMEAVATVGATTKALDEATQQLEGHIDELPISDDEKEKLKETLGTGTIKEKLEAIAEVVETVEHFEAMGTDTVDKMNRWGVNANGINGLLWLRTMAEASGRLGQKFTDGIVTPVLEPVAKAAEEAGIEGVDAGEIAKTILPVQEVAEEASKALLTGAKNVLGGDNILDQLGQNAENDDEWRNIRTFP